MAAHACWISLQNLQLSKFLVVALQTRSRGPAKWLGIYIALAVGFVGLEHGDFTSYIFNRPKKNSRLTEFVQGLRRRSNL